MLSRISTTTAPLLVFLAVLLYGLVHSWLASLTLKALVRRLSSHLTDRFYRLAYNLFALLSLAPVLALPFLLPDRRIYTIPNPWLAFTLALQGLALGLLGIGLLETGVWSFLGVRQLTNPKPEHSEQLVTRGLYSWVRHPLYAAGLAFIWLTPVMTWNILALNIGLTLYLLIGAALEERKLLYEFGEAYARYRKRTPMLIPSISFIPCLNRKG